MNDATAITPLLYSSFQHACTRGSRYALVGERGTVPKKRACPTCGLFILTQGPDGSRKSSPTITVGMQRVEGRCGIDVRLLPLLMSLSVLRIQRTGGGCAAGVRRDGKDFGLGLPGLPRKESQGGDRDV